MLAARGDRVDAEDRRARAARAACRTIWPGTPRPNTTTRSPMRMLASCDAVQRHRADMREDADARVGAVREQAGGGVVLAHDMRGAVAPGAEDELAGPDARHGAAGLDDHADLLVAEVADGKGPARASPSRNSLRSASQRRFMNGLVPRYCESSVPALTPENSVFSLTSPGPSGGA